MKVEIIANGTVSFALIPENDMDRAAIKMSLKQSNEFVEITKQTQILNKASFTEGLIIQPVTRVNKDDTAPVLLETGVVNGPGTMQVNSGQTQINEE